MSAPALEYVERAYENLVHAECERIGDLSLHDLMDEASGDEADRAVQLARYLIVLRWEQHEVGRACCAWVAAHPDEVLIRIAPGGSIEHLPVAGDPVEPVRWAVHPDSGPRHELVVVRDDEP